MPTRTLLLNKLRLRTLSGFKRSSLYLVILTSLWVARPSFGETLKDLLLSYKVPTVSYTEQQLSTSVQGTGLIAHDRAVIIYSEVSGGASRGPFQVVEYDSARKATRTRRLYFNQDDPCLGSPEEVYLIDHYTLFSTHINPSAECLLLLDEKLAIRNRFYGFFPVRTAPGHVAITENMVHFAPVHPERMQVVNLRTSATVEIYPPANDPLRMQLSLQHEKMMPSPETCMRMNDPCDPGSFDEDFYPVSTDNRGRLAFVASQSASHIFAENAEPQIVAEQSVFYSYVFEKSHWLYCEEHLENTAVSTLQSALKDHFNDEISRHCRPNQQVIADKDNGLNPLRNPKKQARSAERPSRLEKR